MSRDWGSLAIAGLHLTVLWAFAVAQPLFDLLSDNPEFFAIRGSEPVDIVVLAVGLVIVPPLVLTIVEAIAGLAGRRLRAGLHLVFVAVLVAAVALPALEAVLGQRSSRVLLPLALVAGAGVAYAYARKPPVRSLATVLVPAPLLFLVLFLFLSPVTKLVTGKEAEVDIPELSSNTPVVMIVFDELPLNALLGADGRVDATRFPGFGALAERSYWFRNATTVDARTESAVPAILTGNWPREDSVPTAADHPRNLFTLLGRSHRMHVTETVTRLGPTELRDQRSSGDFGSRFESLLADSKVISLHLLLPDDLRSGLPSISNRWGDFSGTALDGAASTTRGTAQRGAGAIPSEQAAAAGQDRPGLMKRFSDGFKPVPEGSKPPLHFLHLLFPHSPWQYLPSGRQYGSGTAHDGQILGRWSKDPSAPTTTHQRHLLQLQYVDRLLARALRRLRAAGLFDRSLIVVTADHGITFQAGQDPRAITTATVPDIAPVPLFIKAPGQRSARIEDAHVQSIDILPTVAELMNERLPWRVDGRSALGPNADRRTLRLYDSGGKRRDFDAGQLASRRDRALRLQVAQLGSNDNGRLYGVGPYSDLLGDSVADLELLPGDGARASIDQAPLLTRVRKRSGFVPAHLTGQVDTSEVRAPVALAVAVNGRIAAVGTRPRGGPVDFSLVVPESALRDGANRVQLLAISRDTGRTRLTSLGEAGGPGSTFTLAGGAILDGSGRRIKIGQRVRGGVDQSREVGPLVRLEGWAAEGRNPRPVDRVLGFSGSTLLFDARPREVRPDIAKLLKADSPLSAVDLGWQAEIPEEHLRGARGRVSVYGLEGTDASLLSFSCAGGPQEVGCPRFELAGKSIRPERGRAIPIARGGFEGFVDVSAFEGANLRLGGWALTSDGARPVDRFVAFAGDRFLFAAGPTVARREIASQFKAQTDLLGFSLTVPRRSVSGRAGQIRVFGVADGRAEALPFYCKAGAKQAVGC